MLQANFIKQNRAIVLEGLKKRNFKDAEAVIDAAIELDENRKKTQNKLDNILSEQGKLAKEIGELIKNGKKEEAENIKSKNSLLKEESSKFSQELENIEEELKNLLYTIPNIPYKLVKAGKSAEDNENIFQAGKIPDLGKDAIPHWDLAKKYDFIDFELGVKITGAGFPVYKGKGAKLQRSLINYFLDKNTSAGYFEVQPPHLVNQASGYGTGQLPDKEGQMYHCQVDDLYLIPTAEVPVTNIFRDVLLDEKELPACYTAYTPCFRREAGSYGKDVRGLNRLHQFDKVEIVRVEKPENSYQALEKMVEHVKGILNELELPYRILRLCGGDMGFTSAMTYDFEVFSAAQQKWLEVSSVSNFETFQANRLKLRFKDKDGNKQLAHTLNGSSLALPRIVAALLENNQTPDGIKIPKILQKYTGFEVLS